MTLNFPNAPTNGQVFQGYQYSTPKGVWQAFPQVNPGQYGAVPGSIMLWFSDVIPTAALAMEGQTITGGVGLFPALAAIYPAWVSGANLVLPDTRGRVLVGRDTAQAEFDVLGEAGGGKTHTLTVPEMPSHTHSLPSVYQNIGGFLISGAASNHTFTIANGTGAAGGSQPHNNLQPYIVARYIVWAASIVGQYDPVVQQALAASVAALTPSVAALTPSVATLTSDVAALTSKTSNIAVVQVDTVNRTAGASWTFGPTFDTISGFKANSRVKFFYHVPSRNQSGSWGGIYIEPQVSWNGQAWQSLGSTGFENMVLNGEEILTYNNTLLLVPELNFVFSARFRFVFMAYDGTTGWGNHLRNINATSGTAPMMTGNNGNQHFPHIIVEEIPA